MNVKRNLRLYVAGLLLLSVQMSAALSVPSGQEITVDQLADICEQLESSITDISVEYDWLMCSDMTLEQRLKRVSDRPVSIILGPAKRKVLCSVAPFDLNNPDALIFDRYVFEDSSTTMRDPNDICDHVIKRCYDGQIAKTLSIRATPPILKSGQIFKPDTAPNPWISGPVKAFSVLRFRAIYKIPLSQMLREEISRLDTTVKKFGGFDTIKIDFLQPTVKKPYMRIYFSIDHGYYPVGYENLSLGDETVFYSVEINSLEEVAGGLWFPSSGALIYNNSEDNLANLYEATSPIVVNQGLTEKDFDIEFPPGTKVRDKIQDKEYIVPE